jgi:hypothetical protein
MPYMIGQIKSYILSPSNSAGDGFKGFQSKGHSALANFLKSKVDNTSNFCGTIATNGRFFHITKDLIYVLPCTTHVQYQATGSMDREETRHRRLDVVVRSNEKVSSDR